MLEITDEAAIGTFQFGMTRLHEMSCSLVDWCKQLLANFTLISGQNLSNSSSRGSSDSKHPGLRCSAFLAELVANASQFLTDRATYGMEPLVNSGAAQYTPILSQISGADKPSSA